MKFEQIEQVIEIASTGSISKAANNLYMKQPNVSVSIKSLEEELGQELFKRNAHGIEVTKFGRDFISLAEPIYNQYLYLKGMCQELREQSQFVFGVSSQYFKFVSTIFIDLYKKYRSNNIHLSLLEESFTGIVESVAKQNSEIGVLLMLTNQKKGFIQLFKSKGVEYVKLCECPPHIIIGPSNPLYEASPEFATVDMLKDQPYVTYKQDENQSLGFANQLWALGHYNRITISDRGTLNEIIINTDAFFIASHIQTAYTNTEYYKNVKAIPLRGLDANFEIGWIKQKGRQLSNIGTEFITTLEDVMQK